MIGNIGFENGRLIAELLWHGEVIGHIVIGVAFVPAEEERPMGFSPLSRLKAVVAARRKP